MSEIHLNVEINVREGIQICCVNIKNLIVIIEIWNYRNLRIITKLQETF